MVDEQGCVEGFGVVWFNNEATTNMFCHADLVDEFHLTCNDWVHDCFYLETPNKTSMFKRTNELYSHDTNDREMCMTVHTVEDDKRAFTNGQIMEAEKARELLYKIGFPSTTDF